MLRIQQTQLHVLSLKPPVSKRDPVYQDTLLNPAAVFGPVPNVAVAQAHAFFNCP